MGRSIATSTGSALASRLLIALGTYAAAGGLLSLAGWALDVPRLTDWDGRGISIQPNTTLAAMSAGGAAVLVGLGRPRAGAALGAIAGVIGASALFQTVSGVDLGVDRLLLFDRPWGRGSTLAPGRMGPPASVAWVLVGVGFLLQRGGRRRRRLVPAIGVAVTAIAALSVIGSLLGADRLYTVPRLTAIAFQTSTLLVAVGMALLASVPERQPLRGLLADSAAGVLTRRTLPFVVVLPIVLGLLRVRGQALGLYDTAMGTAMLVLALIGLLCVLLWWGAAAVARHELALEAASRRSRRQIAASNAKLATTVAELEGVFRAAPVGIAVGRGAACEQIQVNAAFATMLGVGENANASLTGPEAARLPFRVLDEHGHPVAPAELPLQRAAATGMPVAERTLVVERADGQRVVAAGSAVPVADAAGRPAGAIGVFIDVTTKRRAETEREELLALAQRARAEAETANRAKDEFLAVLSHELRSPLNAMLGWVRILRRAGTGDALVARAVETLERNVWSQARVIDDLLDISRITSGKLEIERACVDLAAVAAGTVESMRPVAAAKRQTLLLDLPDEAVWVAGDAARLQQVAGNVLHNAIKFTPERGRVSVTLQVADGHAELAVDDSGDGIDAALLPNVFDRFVQSDSSTMRRHGGLGLGLAIVKQLTTLHGGTVTAESAGPGHGARFTIRLPLAARVPRAAPHAAADGRTVPRADIAALDVLIVEDDDDSRDALEMVLLQSGARVRAVASAPEALAAYTARPPDVLVSDISMPDTDGYSLIRAIRASEAANGRRTAAIAMTGFASRRDHETALRAGFDDHVGKPVDVDALLERVRVLAATRTPT